MTVFTKSFHGWENILQPRPITAAEVTMEEVRDEIEPTGLKYTTSQDRWNSPVHEYDMLISYHGLGCVYAAVRNEEVGTILLFLGWRTPTKQP